MKTKILGVIIDHKFTWQDHIMYMSKNILKEWAS